MAKYNYVKQCNPGRLEKEIRESEIITSLDYINYIYPAGTDVYFKADLSETDLGILNNLVSIHENKPLEYSKPVTQDGIPIIAPHAFPEVDGMLSQTYGEKLICIAGQTTKAYYKVINDVFKLAGGEYWITNYADINEDDFIELDIVDHDNILGHGVDFVIKSAIISEMVAGEYHTVRDRTPKAGGVSTIPKGLYLMLSYTSYGSTNIKFYWTFNFYDK